MNHHTLLVVVVALFGCGKSPTSPQMQSHGMLPTDAKATLLQELEKLPESMSAEDFFPTNIGTSWSYTITVPANAKPLLHQEVEWRMSDRTLIQPSSGIFFGALDGDGSVAQKYSLQLNIASKDNSKFQSFDDEMSIEIKKDDLGVFHGVDSVSFATSGSPTFWAAFLVSYYTASSPEAPGVPGVADGHAFRMVYAIGGELKPGQELGNLERESQERLVVHGWDLLPEENTLAFKVVRKVSGTETELPSFVPESLAKEANERSIGFDEHMWFAKGRGLVRLEQHVKESTTMVWRLDSFDGGQ